MKKTGIFSWPETTEDSGVNRAEHHTDDLQWKRHGDLFITRTTECGPETAYLRNVCPEGLHGSLGLVARGERN